LRRPGAVAGRLVAGGSWPQLWCKASRLWAVERACRELSRSSKRFKWLTKISGKDKSTEGDVDHIERSGVHLRLQIRLRPAQVASGVWVFVALVLRNPSHVGQFVPTCKIGISP